MKKKKLPYDTKDGDLTCGAEQSILIRAVSPVVRWSSAATCK
jgi:hypothetical protein